MLNLSNLKKKIKVFMLAAVIILGSIFFCILIINFQVKKSFLNSENKAQDLYRVQLSQERQEEIRKDLDKKYPLDSSAFEALAKKIEIEGKLTQAIEGKLKQVTQDLKNKNKPN